MTLVHFTLIGVICALLIVIALQHRAMQFERRRRLEIEDRAITLLVPRPEHEWSAPLELKVPYETLNRLDQIAVSAVRKHVIGKIATTVFVSHEVISGEEVGPDVRPFVEAFAQRALDRFVARKLLGGA